MAKKRQVTTSADGQNIVQVNVKIPKKSVVKRATHKKAKVKTRIIREIRVKKSDKLERTIIENLVELQKVNTDMAEKFDKLSEQISGLLTLFEMSARSFAEQPEIKEGEKDKEFLEKINTLLGQNKTIAKGLTLLGERIKERLYGEPPEERAPVAPARPAPPLRTPFTPQPIQRAPPNEEEFKPSVGGKPLPKY